LGAQVAFDIDVRFKTGGAFDADTRSGPAGVGGARHEYEAGFVRVDATGNAQGYTSWWGYESGGQYDSGAQRLRFHSTSSFVIEEAEYRAKDDPHVGMELVYNQDMIFFEGMQMGWELGLGWLPLEIGGRQRFRGLSTRTVHEFDTGGIALPGFPYSGSSSGAGPLISDIAIALPDEEVPGEINSAQTLDTQFYQVSLGPSAHWRPMPQLSFRAGAGFTLGVVDAEYRFSDQIDGREINRGRFGDTKLAYGGYVNGLVMYHGDLAEEQFDVYLGMAFRSLSGVEIREGQRQAELELDTGLYLTGGVSWSY
jgi:hypothetical protein